MGETTFTLAMQQGICIHRQGRPRASFVYRLAGKRWRRHRPRRSTTCRTMRHGQATWEGSAAARCRMQRQILATWNCHRIRDPYSLPTVTHTALSPRALYQTPLIQALHRQNALSLIGQNLRTRRLRNQFCKRRDLPLLPHSLPNSTRNLLLISRPSAMSVRHHLHVPRLPQPRCSHRLYR